jgi:hypothetical protein
VGAFRNTVAFLAGVALVMFGVTDDCPRVGAIAVGLLMMGLFTVPEVMKVVRGNDVGTPPDGPPEPSGGVGDS